MTDIMKLATDYAQACYNLANPDSYDAERAEEARAALQSAIQALQAENERLTQDRDEWRDSTIAANANAASEEKRRREMQDQRDQLKSRLDDMGKGEPVAHVYAIERTGRPLVAWDDARGIGLGDKLYAAPKALAPLTDEQELWLWQNGDHMLAFKHLYPCFTEGGDPMTLGEPVARAIFKTSHDRSGGTP